jgi:hypothetical protein
MDSAKAGTNFGWSLGRGKVDERRAWHVGVLWWRLYPINLSASFRFEDDSPSLIFYSVTIQALVPSFLNPRVASKLFALSHKAWDLNRHTRKEEASIDYQT